MLGRGDTQLQLSAAAPSFTPTTINPAPADEDSSQTENRLQDEVNDEQNKNNTNNNNH